MDYEFLTLEDRQRLAQEQLAAREADHFRLSLLASEQTAELMDLERDIDKIKQEATKLSQEAKRPTPPSPPSRPRDPEARTDGS